MDRYADAVIGESKRTALRLWVEKRTPHRSVKAQMLNDDPAVHTVGEGHYTTINTQTTFRTEDQRELQWPEASWEIAHRRRLGSFGRYIFNYVQVFAVRQAEGEECSEYMEYTGLYCPQYRRDVTSSWDNEPSLLYRKELVSNLDMDIHITQDLIDHFAQSPNREDMHIQPISNAQFHILRKLVRPLLPQNAVSENCFKPEKPSGLQ